MSNPYADLYDSGDATPASENPYADYYAQSSSQPANMHDAMVEQTIGGVVETAPATAGMIAGAKIGGAVLGPWGALGGGVVGLVGGGLIGSELKEEFITPVEDYPEDVQPYAVGGETTGRVLGGMLAPHGFAMTGVSSTGKTMIGRWFNNVVDTARRSPLKTAGAEAVTGLGSGIGAAVAQEYMPGDQLARFGGELIGGVAAPGSMIINGYNASKAAFGKYMAKLHPRARQNQAVQYIVDTLAEFGEDPVVVARLLRENKGLIESLPAAERTGSIGLAAIQKNLGVNFKGDAKEQADAGMEVLTHLMNTMSQQGDADALRAVAEMRSSYIRGLFAERIKEVERDAVAAAVKVTDDAPMSRMELSRAAHKAMTTVVQDARTMEKQLWSAVPDDVPAFGENFMRSIDSVVEDLGAAGRKHIPADAFELKSTLKSLEKEGSPISVKELTQYRSELLEIARSAMEGDKTQPKVAMAANRLADAILDDLNEAMSGDDAYMLAREFTKEFHDTFSRSFAGKVMAKGVYGERVAPELLLQRSMATDADARALQLQSIADATEFMAKRMDDTVHDGQISTMFDAQERIIRLAAENAVKRDPTTGVITGVSAEKMSKFVRDNAQLLNRFPAAKEHMEQAISSEVRREAYIKSLTGRYKAIEQRGKINKMLRGNVVRRTMDAAYGENPEHDLKMLANMAKKDETGDAIQGLRAAVLEGVLKGSAGPDGQPNLINAMTRLTKPGVGQRKSIVEIMVDNQIIDKHHLDQLITVSELAKRIVKAQKSTARVDEIDDASGILIDMFTRMAGSTAAVGASKAAGSSVPSIIVAGAGSRAATNIVEKIPGKKLELVIADLMSDPKKLADLLEKGPTPTAEIQKAARLHTYLFTSGILTGDFDASLTELKEEVPQLSESALSAL